MLQYLLLSNPKLKHALKDAVQQEYSGRYRLAEPYTDSSAPFCVGTSYRHPEILNSFGEETLEVLYPQLARAGVTRDEVRRYLEVAKIIFGTNSIWDNSKAKVHMEAANYGLV